MLEIYVFESSFAVIFCSLCRLYHIGLVNFGLLAILIERGLAIYFVTDYEMKSRPYIGVTLGIVTIALSIIAAPLVSFEYVSWTFGGAVIVLGISSAMSFLFLLYRTQLRYKRIVAERLASNYIRYSLSFRFQLNENIRSMKLRQLNSSGSILQRRHLQRLDGNDSTYKEIYSRHQSVARIRTCRRRCYLLYAVAKTVEQTSKQNDFRDLMKIAVFTVDVLHSLEAKCHN
ncbi:hypothetical protein Q1695_012341 [Nippostrongylus brasiliensis]|nr:hypothetical protein Q1695_012341 [Nippostrongylus brasiliensis]